MKRCGPIRPLSFQLKDKSGVPVVALPLADTPDLNNYRLISMQYKWTTHFLFANNVRSSHRSGFRVGCCTTTAATVVINDIVSALGSTKHCAARFTGLSKAFDTVNHRFLLDKSGYAGFKASSKWFWDYLSAREDYVAASGFYSQTLSLNNGVQQGPILGPLLFSLYIDEICSSVAKFLCRWSDALPHHLQNKLYQVFSVFWL